MRELSLSVLDPILLAVELFRFHPVRAALLDRCVSDVDGGETLKFL